MGWTYTLTNAAAQFLGADETRTEVFTVTVTDEAGASSTQTVTITIQGINEGLTITSGVQSGTEHERAHHGEPDRRADRDGGGDPQRR